MNTFLIILLILAMIGAVVALVRGIIAFLQTSTAQLKSDSEGKEMMLKQNKMMMNRVIFQAIAVVIIIILIAAGRN
jgi:NADH:ubiquinone oxidoreductase subunit 6 (subunit J)